MYPATSALVENWGRGMTATHEGMPIACPLARAGLGYQLSTNTRLCSRMDAEIGNVSARSGLGLTSIENSHGENTAKGVQIDFLENPPLTRHAQYF